MSKTVILDVDDTLYDQLLPFKQTIDQVFPLVHNSIAPRDLYVLFRKVSDEVFHFYTSGTWSLRKMRYERIRQTLATIGYPEISPTEEAAFQTAYQTALENIHLEPCMQELLNLLNTAGVPLGIITNGTTQHQTKKIQQLGVERWIPAKNWFISESTGFKKPEKAIFQLVANHFDSLPEQLLYIGDSFENDIMGCRPAGWDSLWLNHRQRKHPAEAAVTSTYTTESFANVTPIVLDWLKK